jgi:hypothetical protein
MFPGRGAYRERRLVFLAVHLQAAKCDVGKKTGLPEDNSRSSVSTMAAANKSGGRADEHDYYRYDKYPRRTNVPGYKDYNRAPLQASVTRRGE